VLLKEINTSIIKVNECEFHNNSNRLKNFLKRYQKNKNTIDMHIAICYSDNCFRAGGKFRKELKFTNERMYKVS